MIRHYSIAAIKKAKNTIQIAPSGFRFGYIPDLFHEASYRELAKTFPDVSNFKLVDKQSGGGRKRFYTGPHYYSGLTWGCVCHMQNLPKIWKEVLDESADPELVELFQDVTGVRLNSLCNFGMTFGNEGCVQEPHIDGAVRADDPSPVHSTMAAIMYFNENPDPIGGTAVYAPDRTTILARAPHLRNGFFFFEQHPQAWHGFPPMPKGAERRIVSLSYSQESRLIGLKQSLLHRATCSYRLKDTLRKFLK
jgi:hypothetical protein